MNSGSSSVDGGLPCSYRRTPILHGESLAVDECTKCDCDNSTVICNLRQCPAISCSSGEVPVLPNEECCRSCNTCEYQTVIIFLILNRHQSLETHVLSVH